MVSEQNYSTRKFFTENLLPIEMKKTQLLMNKPVYSELLMLDQRKTAMCKFSYVFIKPKYGGEAKLCCMDTNSFIIHVKTDDVYKDIAEDVETRFGTSNYEIERPLPVGWNKQVIGLTKNELGS